MARLGSSAELEMLDLRVVNFVTWERVDSNATALNYQFLWNNKHVFAFRSQNLGSRAEAQFFQVAFLFILSELVLNDLHLGVS